MSSGGPSHETPSLFDALPPIAVSGVAEELPDEKGPERAARDFVRWCFSFGETFRNSPDLINLRYWAQRTKTKLKDSEDQDILSVARPLFFKRVEQITRKAEASN